MYATFGLAMFQAQAMEAALKSALIVAQVSDRRFATLAEYDAAFDKHFKTMLGRLIEALKPFISDDNRLADDLQLALAVRNELAHHFFWDRADLAVTYAGQEAIVAECRRAVDLFSAVEAALASALRRYAAKAGMGAALHDDKVAAAQQQWVDTRQNTVQDRCGRCGAATEESQTGQWRVRRCTSCSALALV